MVLFLFLTHLALGIVFTLVLVSREAGVKFFRFNAGLAAALIAVAFVFRPPELSSTTTGRIAVTTLLISEAAIVVYWLTIGRMLASIRPALVWLACAAGLVALVAQAVVATSDWTFDVGILTIASFLSSAALLGGASTSMILRTLVPGHPFDGRLSSPVDREAIHRFDGRADCRRGCGGRRCGRDVATGRRTEFLALHHVGERHFFWQRVLFGLGGPALLSTSRGKRRRSARRSLQQEFSTLISSRWWSERCSPSISCSRRACRCSRLQYTEMLRIASRSGTCAISAYEPRQGRKAAALSGS